jgi:hypothetical protein
MAVTLKQTEATPADYPSTDGLTLSTAAAALDAAMIWQRIESYIAHRWSERDVTWVVEGPGEWTAPLTPATITSVDVWSGADDWQPIELSPSPLGGYFLPGSGPYRFTGTVGGGNLPEGVREAFRRLAEYMANAPGQSGASSERVTAGSLSFAYTYSPSWVAAAMQNSGAGDLLRRYRRAS